MTERQFNRQCLEDALQALEDALYWFDNDEAIGLLGEFETRLWKTVNMKSQIEQAKEV